MSRPLVYIAGFVALAGCSHQTPVATATSLPPAADSGREITADQQVIQALNRLTFGPRPGDVLRVRQMGVDRWMAEQLAPDGIEDGATDAFVAHFKTYDLPVGSLMRDYPQPQQLVREFKTNRLSDSAAARMAIDSLRRSQARLTTDAQAARVARAVMSRRQLDEVMADFWENHFNVFAGKGGPERYYLADFDRSVIRPHALGKFRDLLGAVAHSPAMLYYLDNWESVADSGQPTLTDRRPFRAGRKVRGLNENYGRELLELHTLGVDGGYTQQDVIEVARAFTGWSIQRPTGEFVFRPEVHDAGPKQILGVSLPAGRGIEDGEEVLDVVAKHPATARFIARKLCIRFVSDSPPPALVDRAAATFTHTDGDIRQVVWTIVTSPEFFSRAAYRVKVKTPFEVVVSALRAMDAAPDSTPRTAQVIARLGEPIFGHQAPNGYAETGESWMSAGGILGRINFGLAVATNRIPGVSLTTWPLSAELATAPRPAQVDGVVSDLLGGDASPDTRRILLSGNHPMLASAATDSTMQDMQPNKNDLHGLAQVVGLALGAPEFQRR